MRESSRRMALCGVLTALSAAVMFTLGLVPLATFATPALAGLFLLPLAVEYGGGCAMIAYAAVGILSMIIVPDKEISLTFVFFLGWYPAAKAWLDKLRPTVIQWLVKIALFNLCIFAMYGLLLFVFPLGSVVEEFAGATLIFMVGLVGLANLAFIVYDFALARMRLVYRYRLRPKLFKK